MGSLCGVRGQDENHMIRSRQKSQAKQQTQPPIEDKFKDMEEFKDGRTIGEGIKKIPAFKCSLAYDQLNALREQFWSSKTSHRRIWLTLKSCCETDASSAVHLIQAAELACVGENMKCVVDNNTGEIFNLPNFLLADPLFERDFDVYSIKDIKEKKINIIFTSLINSNQIEITVTNKYTGEKMKELYSQKVNIDIKKYKIRLLFRGQEIKDNLCLYHFNIENNSHIQVSISEIEN